MSSPPSDADAGYLAGGGEHGEDLAPGRYVTDGGGGMDDATRARMFDPFCTTRSTGRGLGLATTLGIIRGHMGGIQVSREAGRGTTLKGLLAVAAGDAADAPPVAADTPVAPPPEAVAVFDARAEEIDAVVLDLEMPGLSGEVVVQALRERRPQVKVPLPSGYSEQETSSRFVGQDIAGFLQKPYNVEALQDAVAGLIGSPDEETGP